jgi:aldose 1-epimerase
MLGYAAAKGGHDYLRKGVIGENNTFRVAPAGMTLDAGFLVLKLPATRLILDPMRGGAIREFTWRGQNVLRATPADAGDDPFDMACFAMVPFVNRIAGGRFEFAGRTVRLQPNWSEDPHPLHGQGWRGRWRTVSSNNTSATLRFEGGGGEWPWRYAAEQRFQLRDNGLLLELSVENHDAAAMPAMLGLHPYFPDAGRARLQAKLPRMWLTDREVLPLKETATPEECRFDRGRAVRGVSLDHSFSGWDGVALLRWPGHTCTVRASNCGFLHVYAPAGRDFFCIEPQSAASGAFGRNAAEATIIPPGKRFAIRVHFELGRAR